MRVLLRLAAAALVLASFASCAATQPPPPPPPGAEREIFETDINAAGHGDLTELPGITDNLADRIIAGRPYRKKSDLVARRILTPLEYGKVEHLIVALPSPK